MALSILICLQHARTDPMNAVTHTCQLRLEARALYEIPDAAGVPIACGAGSVWITLDHDPRDIVLEAGDRFCATEHRRALVYAFSTAQLELGQPAATTTREARPRAGWFSGAGALLPAGLARAAR
jgi:Protein of unknown function (DUF2917)